MIFGRAVNDPATFLFSAMMKIAGFLFVSVAVPSEKADFSSSTLVA